MTGDLRDDVRALFTALAGHEPDGLWSAPGRVNLIGEHTDYNDGFVLPFAIDRRTVVALGTRDDAAIRVASTFAAGEGWTEAELAELEDLRADRSAGTWVRYPLGIAWALGQTGADLAAVPGVDIVIDSNVPTGAGLSSSAAIECAVGVALNDVWRLGLDKPTIARAGQRSENDFVGAPTGILDQSASMLAERDHAVFLDCRSLESETVPLGFEEAGLCILVIDTGQAHEHATGGYRDRREACERGARELGVAALRDLTVDDLDRARDVLDEVTFRRVRHVVTEDARVLETVRRLREEGPRAIGDLLDASHASMRDDFEITTPQLDLAVETARASGALGARMTGGGFGGSAIALIPEDLVSQAQVAIDGAFAEHGWGQPDVFVVRPSDGAGREQ
ncbi:galactokinase [Pseudolysinimonas sp.]|uniref:galactokinase n=1 Tax=Pseudolysinimonas sp. TaxID=2680009 RepID=UPI003F819C66